MRGKFFLVDFYQMKNAKIKTHRWSVAQRWLSKGIQVGANILGYLDNQGEQICSINPITNLDTENQIICTPNNTKYEMIGSFFYAIISEARNHVADDFLIEFFQTENPKIRTRNWKKANNWLKNNVNVDVCLWEETLHRRGIRIVPVMSIGVTDKTILNYSHIECYPLKIIGSCYYYRYYFQN